VAAFDATQALLIKKGTGYATLQVFKGKKLGVQSGSTGKELVASEQVAGVTMPDLEDLATQQQAPATNQIDGAVNDLPGWTERPASLLPGVGPVSQIGSRDCREGRHDSGNDLDCAVWALADDLARVGVHEDIKRLAAGEVGGDPQR
jgi:hypothetical protein